MFVGPAQLLFGNQFYNYIKWMRYLWEITNSCIMVISWRTAIASYGRRWLLTVIIRHSFQACYIISAYGSRSSCRIAKEPSMNFCRITRKYELYIENYNYTLKIHPIFRLYDNELILEILIVLYLRVSPLFFISQFWGNVRRCNQVTAKCFLRIL